MPVQTIFILRYIPLPVAFLNGFEFPKQLFPRLQGLIPK